MNNNPSVKKRCIYCLRTKLYNPSDSTLSEFNTEHVLQAALTKKINHSFSLKGRVCSACNKFFGDNHDRILSRNTLEAIERIRTGMKPIKELKDIRPTHVSFKSANANPVYDDAPMTPIDSNGQLTYKYKPHLALLKNNGQVVRLFWNSSWIEITEHRCVIQGPSLLLSLLMRRTSLV